jgi:2-polyprenyl-3-methyl-5-hydroxy-6-metoxy-1,4-benzoquinol methylase
MSDERYVDAPPAGPDAWRETWNDDRRFRPRPSRHEWLLRIVRRLVRRAGEPDLERQQNFNVVLLDLIAGLRNDLASAREELRRDIEAVQADVRRADQALAAEIAAIRELIPIAARRNDALIAALDQKIESVAVRVRDVTNPVIERAAPSELRASDVLYRRLEDGMRGSEGEVRESVRDYVELARTHAPLLDVGCGRGELLAACREAGIDARGFDTNERSVADLRARGLDAALAGVPKCFAGIADGSAGSVVAMHVVEHLPVEALFALFAQAARVLRAGGLLIIETPNAEALAMTGSEFWRDPTHLAPRHPAALTLLGREHGFTVDDVRAIHPFPEGTEFTAKEDDAPSLRRLVDALNERLFAGQDLRLVLRRG